MSDTEPPEWYVKVEISHKHKGFFYHGRAECKCPNGCRDSGWHTPILINEIRSDQAVAYAKTTCCWTLCFWFLNIDRPMGETKVFISNGTKKLNPPASDETNSE